MRTHAAPTTTTVPIPEPRPPSVTAPPEPAPEPPPVEAPAAEEPWTLARAWASVVLSLPSLDKVFVHDTATPLAYEDGVLVVIVRKSIWKDRVFDMLKKVDLAAIFPGFQRIQIQTASEGGATGRERRHAAESQARTEARAAAEASPVVRRVLDAFKGELEVVDTIQDGPRDIDQEIEDIVDE